MDIPDAQISYTGLLIVISVCNLLQFFLRPKLFLYEKKDAIVEGEAKEGEKTDKDLVGAEDEHYIWMEKRFQSGRMWAWIINAVVYIIVISIYFAVTGSEIVYEVYLPLDFLLNLCKAIYFFSAFREELQRVE